MNLHRAAPVQLHFDPPPQVGVEPYADDSIEFRHLVNSLVEAGCRYISLEVEDLYRPEDRKAALLLFGFLVTSDELL